MAERRMFAKTIIDSDAFLDMPMSARLLYYDLGMRADDDGFVNSPKKIQRVIGASDDDMKLLIAKKFIIPFESGVVVVKHWKINNFIRSDRYSETKYKVEKSMLELDENMSYRLTSGIPGDVPLVGERDTQVRLGKGSIGNKTIDEFFDSVWVLYPKKEGKGQVSKTQREKLYKIGCEELSRCIERYKTAKQGTDKQYLQHGSTFFNSGYVDYLDKNYNEEEKPQKEGMSSWGTKIYK
jgi:hypothetical protein